jgi:GMP reductase
MQISQSVKLDFDDVLMRPKKSDLVSRQDAQLLRFFNFKHHDGKIQPGFIPIIAANMDTIGTPEMAYALMYSQMSTALHKSFDEKLEHKCAYNYVWFTIGTKDFDQEMSKLTQHKFNRRGSDVCNPFMICIDVANGYASGFVDKVNEVRETFHNAVIMAGNVCTPELTQDLLINGADIVKVGIGPGKVCRTRMVTGVGYPQLSAIMECADCAHGLKGHVCADGGIREYGDIAKAFGAAIGKPSLDQCYTLLITMANSNRSHFQNKKSPIKYTEWRQTLPNRNMGLWIAPQKAQIFGCHTGVA